MKLLDLTPKAILRLAVIVIVCGFALTAMFVGPVGVVPTDAQIKPSPSSIPKGTGAARSTPTPKPARYTDFPHGIKAHQAVCSLCHKFPSDNWKKVRAEADAFPDVTEYPKHASCVGCHKQQFFSGRQPAICTICHVNPGPRNSTRHPFPNPREVFDRSPKAQRAPESDFVVAFPHDKHIEIVSGEADPSYKPAKGEESCSVCHRTYMPAGASADDYFTRPPAAFADAFWLKKGTFKTSPIGHTTCFTCHSVDSGLEPLPTNCAACHKPRISELPTDFDAGAVAKMNIKDRLLLLTWRRRDNSATFRHEFAIHAEMECASCHNVKEINTVDRATGKIAISSCAMCHMTSTVEEGGALNYEAEQRKKDPSFQCVKCHIAFGRMPIPESHTKALAGQ